jgi:hypothetical protein
MAKINKRYLLAGILCAVLAWRVGVDRYNHAEFRKEIWDRGIKYRAETYLPSTTGKTKSEVIAMFGQPDDIDAKNPHKTWFSYLVFAGDNKEVLYIQFHDDIVIDYRLDNSGNYEFDQIQEKKLEASRQKQ